jgi:hypothetical protein
MNSINSKKSSFFGWLIIGLFFYILITVSLFSFSAISIANKQIIDIWPINKYQQYFYFKAMRNIWQFDPNCVELDNELIYKPKIGRCEFNNPEFNTILNFDNLGRSTPNRVSAQQSDGIAIVGDSFAMGWGVNDDETFANVIQSKTSKPVYNLGVSSYGTDREIKRLIQSGILSKIDTIVIQYCENDLHENEAAGDKKLFSEEKEKFNSSFNGSRAFSGVEKMKLILISLRASVSEPFKAIKRLVLGPKSKGDFNRHQLALEKVLNLHQDSLKDKKILIFYLNGYDANYQNFPQGPSKENKNLRYFDFQKNTLSKEDFYSIDGHLNTKGHKNLGLAITNFLDLEANNQRK